MDDSSLPNDPGTSPWAATAASSSSISSPQQQQQQQSGFGQDEQQQQTSQISSTVSDLQSPQNQQQQRVFSSSESPYAGGFQDGEAGARGTGSQPYSSNHEYHQENSQNPFGGGQVQGDEGMTGQQQQQPPQQQRAPQYKLQAKVTGLERTGRKDPILRFDVYVSNFLV